MTATHPVRKPPPRREPPLVLTVRGRRVLLVLALAAILLVVLTVKAVVSDASPAETDPSASPKPTSTATGKSTTAASATATSKPTATPGATQPSPSISVSSTTSTGIKRSGLVGTGTFTTSTWAKPPLTKTATVRNFIVKVEGGVRADPNDVAAQVHAILNDPRGWTGYRGSSFGAVSDPAKADFVIHLVSPPTATKMCRPLDVGGKWSCAAGNKVILNSDRWFLMTPTYGNLTDYRAYMVNHEVGHYLGRGHVGCPKKGAPAPVMVQQSISLRGCVPNAWPGTPSTTT
ncbi:DUF3152 domain-containing protein [Knoellia subterranea]|uniref:Membrane protein n=1 Tax=Knoellia subterranea KCTC 19937 TaxID=1385521 RepID=A0A0A0JIP7_9MICO|nr:DUF3152 domain-containing protein [Knoellia subterranea]KGN36624.1 membrane protein [Knoellia subterranea KCTC 19937]